MPQLTRLKFVTTLHPGNVIRYGNRRVEMIAPAQPGVRFDRLTHVPVRDCATGEELTLTFTTAERVLVEVTT